jgi:hypothetical protein
MKIDIKNVIKGNYKVPSRIISYKYDGHSGYQPPDLDWKMDTCFSTICNNTTKTLCRINKPREVDSVEWNRMVRMVKKVSRDVRKCLNDTPPTREGEATMMFNSGNGYNDYFAFCLWRIFYLSPKLWRLIEYLHYKHKYSVHDSYILASLFTPKIWHVDRDYQIIQKLRTGRMYKGMARRLKNASRFTNTGNYSMARTINCIFGGGRGITKKTWCAKNINDTEYMDEIVKYINL